MSEFDKILTSRNIQKYSGDPLWKFQLSNNEFSQLKTSFSLSENKNKINPVDCALYFAEWWKRCYNGGKPSKEIIFQSLGINLESVIDCDEFYKKAKIGAEILGVKWLKKQNILFFRTLLLQGGLPILHISENQGSYKNFLLAVLEEQPESIEDFMFQPQIINLLPPSSRNDIVYENCLEIVKSILNDETTYDDLLNSNVAIKKINKELRERKTHLQKKQRASKIQNYWILNIDPKKLKLSLRLGLADSYTKEVLEHILGLEIVEKSNHFFINDQLVCVFQKMLSGNYKTEWNNRLAQEWTRDTLLPNCYIIVNNNRFEVKDFITTAPDFSEPSLWVPFSDNEWRLIKGNSTSSEIAAILSPESWKSKQEPELFNLFDTNFNWIKFEGQTEISNEFYTRHFISNVSSFDWTIVSQMPKWMFKAKMVVVQNVPKIIVYNDQNEALKSSDYEVFIKHKSFEIWKTINELNHLPLGCIDVKIVNDQTTAYDCFYNIGNLRIDYSNQNISSAELSCSNNNFDFKIKETPILKVFEQSKNRAYKLSVETKFNKIPNSILASLRIGNSKSLHFEIVCPFTGITLIDQEGKIILEESQLTFNHLHGIRILSESEESVIIKFKNILRPEVIISKELRLKIQPLIYFKDELLRLYFLADAMNHENMLSIELEKNGVSKQYFLKGFTHTLNVENQFQGKLNLWNSEDDLSLYAVPLNCSAENISLIPLLKESEDYKIPKTNFTNQYIIISSYEKNRHLMPRFVSTDNQFKSLQKNERIELYHHKLETSDFKSEIWKEILAYFNICINQNIPFSTFDQLRAVSRSSAVASRAFFFLGINQINTDEFIQKMIPELETDLGFCFHWIRKDDWHDAINEVAQFIGEEYFRNVIALFSNYMNENDLGEMIQFLNGQRIFTDKVYNPFINQIRSDLGERVLKELPDMKPNVNDYYNIPNNEYGKFFLLIKAPIAVAESIKNVQKEFPIWGGNDFREQIRRNIQYAQYLSPEFYNRIILQVLSQN
ncbi:hypothetical protein [Epilithonimonas lactis]|uniref:Uncharacterized protein n=1 Tax=Epilithonimonas lactis TaxID=421072 RepID=A0A085BE62_9FLAO|nr:hypothetical protein [Epilithonimonas lactis]KFC20757.1 hypothetical protein IO89_10925 [Epilithonimonas lactis]SEP60697.1 hypothetical protein SAMN04488097_0057 [Epilithonimonas lactis]